MESDPEARAASLTLRRRLLTALFLALATTGLAGLVPSQSSFHRLATFAPNQHLAHLTRRWGWPSKLICHSQWVVGSDSTHFRLATQQETRRLPAYAVSPQWNIVWGNLARLYGVLAATWGVLLCGRTCYLLRQHKRRSAAARCKLCGYPKAGLPLPRCPECGTPHDHQV